MKKTVILTIGVIYVLAIVIVGFVGMTMRVYNENRYVERIVCVSDGYTKYDSESELSKNYDGFIMKNYQEGLKVEIRCDVFPENATYRDLQYICSESTAYQLVENDDGTATIEFYKKGNAIVTIKSTDNKGTEIKIQIYAL